MFDVRGIQELRVRSAIVPAGFARTIVGLRASDVSVPYKKAGPTEEVVKLL